MPRHGSKQATFVCQHIVGSLRNRNRVGFYVAEYPGNPRPDAWCAACEAKLQRTGMDWTDESEAIADVQLLCGAFYDQAKALNQPN